MAINPLSRTVPSILLGFPMERSCPGLEKNRHEESTPPFTKLENLILKYQLSESTDQCMNLWFVLWINMNESRAKQAHGQNFLLETVIQDWPWQKQGISLELQRGRWDYSWEKGGCRLNRSPSSFSCNPAISPFHPFPGKVPEKAPLMSFSWSGTLGSFKSYE